MYIMMKNSDCDIFKHVYDIFMLTGILTQDAKLQLDNYFIRDTCKSFIDIFILNMQNKSQCNVIF